MSDDVDASRSTGDDVMFDDDVIGERRSAASATREMGDMRKVT